MAVSSLLHVLGVTDHLVGFPLDATVLGLLLLLLLLLLRRLLLLLLLLMMTDDRRRILLLLLLLLRIVQRRRTLRRRLRLLLAQPLALLQDRLIRRPRGPLVSVVTEFSGLLVALLIDDVLSQCEAQGARITVQPQGLL